MQNVPTFRLAARSAAARIFSRAMNGYFSISADDTDDCEQ
jgi:hypothetical protein